MFKQKNAIIVGLCAAISLHGCAVVGPYPSHWPKIGQAKLVGKCPDISGKYKNHGLSSPSDAEQLTLTQILGLEDGDVVEITHSPDVISVSLRTTDGRLVERDFQSRCILDIPGGRKLLLSDLENDHESSFGGMPGILAMSGEMTPLYKAVDGSLIVAFQKSWGGLIVVLPIGMQERVWYRFEPLE